MEMGKGEGRKRERGGVERLKERKKKRGRGGEEGISNSIR